MPPDQTRSPLDVRPDPAPARPDRVRHRPFGFVIARPGGIPVTVRASWLFAVTFLGIVVMGVLREAGVRAGDALLGAVVTGAGSFVSLLGHELAHAFSARRIGGDVVGIEVFFLGGATRLRRPLERPADDFAVALAGPLVNLAAAGALAVLARLLESDMWASVAGLVAYLNALIVVTNLIPGHPLDGGAMVAAAAWARTGDRTRAMLISARVGEVFAYAAIAFGVIGPLTEFPDAGILPVFIGLFLIQAARSVRWRADLRDRLASRRLDEVATPVGSRLDARWTVARAVRDIVASQATSIVVDDDGVVAGVFGPGELEQVPSSTWEQVTLGEVARPVHATADIDEGVVELIERVQPQPDDLLLVATGGGGEALVRGADLWKLVERAARQPRMRLNDS